MKRLALALSTLIALALPGVALAADRDRDGLPDRWERKHNLSTKHKSAQGDPDRDRVDNGNELRERTDPRDRDTDGDGRRDGREDGDRDRLSNAAEDATGNDPRDRDTDDDGIPDGREHAGTVARFVGGVLTIDLAGRGRLRAQATEDTEIECSSEQAAETRHHRGGAARAAQAADPVEDDEAFDPGADDDFDPGDDDGAFDPDADPSADPGDEDPGSDDPGDDDGFPDDFDDEFGGGDDELGGDDGFADEQGSGSCSTAALRRGVAVHEAKLASGRGVFRSIELIR